MFVQAMGRMVRHTDLAEKWLDKVQRASHTTPMYEWLESVLEDAEQFMWAGHEMDLVGGSDCLLLRSVCVARVSFAAMISCSNLACHGGELAWIPVVGIVRWTKAMGTGFWDAGEDGAEEVGIGSQMG